jgi:hypothetical protein
MKFTANKRLLLLGNKFWISAEIGIVTSALLTWMRGGFDDMPSVLVEFWAFGFSVSLFLFWLFQTAKLQRIETTLLRLFQVPIKRDILAFFISLSLIAWTGPTIRAAGYSGWLLYFPVVIFSSLVVCLVAARFPILFGALASGCIVLSLTTDYVQSEWSHPHRSISDLWRIYWQEFTPFRLLVLWLVAFVLSLVGSVPIFVQRRRIKFTTQTGCKV